MLGRLQALMRHSREFPQADGKLIVAGTSVPADASTGYQAGCLYQKTDGGVGSTLYINHGSLSSSLFQPLEAVGSAQSIIQLPLNSWIDETGDPLIIYAAGAVQTPMLSSLDEAWGIRWNNHATPLPIATQVAVPPDLDETEDVVFHLLAGKTGATSGDDVVWTLAAYNNVVGALYDADANFGGAATAMVGTATAKTVAERTVTLAAANIAAAPCVIQLTLAPSDMATDDVILLGTWLEYTKKALAT